MISSRMPLRSTVYIVSKKFIALNEVFPINDPCIFSDWSQQLDILYFIYVAEFNEKKWASRSMLEFAM